MDLEVEPGDWVNIDELKRKLNEEGYEADYENLWSGFSGFFAKMTVEDGVEKKEIFIEGSDLGHLVKDMK